MIIGKGYYSHGEYIYVTTAKIYTDGAMQFMLVGSTLYPIDASVGLFTPSNTLIIFRPKKSWPKDSGVMTGLKKVGTYHYNRLTGERATITGTPAFITLPDGMQPEKGRY